MSGFAWLFFPIKKNNIANVDKVRSDDCCASPFLPSWRTEVWHFNCLFFQKAHFCRRRIYTGLLTAPWKVNKLVATLSPHQLSPPAKPTHRQPRRVCVLGRWGTNGALMEFEENIMYRDDPRREVELLHLRSAWCCASDMRRNTQLRHKQWP